MKNKLLSIKLLLLVGIFVNANEVKDCHFNDAMINRNVFTNHACWKCYENLTDRGRFSKVYCLVTHDELNFTVPGFMINSKCLPFDHRSMSISNLVESSMKSESFEQWKSCCENAIECCDEMIENYKGENFFNTCDAHWNGFSCFKEAEDEEVEKECPYHLSKYDESQCNHFYTRRCQNGSWSSADFTQCHQTERLRVNNIWHIVILTLSLIVCLIQLFAFCFCNKFQNKHLSPVIALIVFIAIRNVLKLISLSIILADSMTLTINSLSCRLLTVFTHFSTNMIYVCLALVALKMLQSIKNATENWGSFIMMSIGLLLAIVGTITWSLMMKIYFNKLCWVVSDENNFHWINDGVQIVMLTIAAFFIVWCLFFTADKFEGETRFLSKIFILPLLTFLMPFALIIASSILSCCGWEEIYKFSMTFLELLQPLSLCLIFIASSLKKLSVPEITIPWFSTKFFSQESQNTSLAPSRLSINREEPLYSWQDVVTCARSSVCYDNDIGSISSISNAPEPYKNYTEPIYEVPKDGSRRHTIRQVMMKAKNINLPVMEEVMPPKVMSPTLPKTIPSEILDDVQLFDFYYKNLDSIFIGDGENVTTRGSVSSDDGGVEKRVSGNRISRLLSFGQLPRSKLNSIDESGKIEEKEERLNL